MISYIYHSLYMTVVMSPDAPFAMATDRPGDHAAATVRQGKSAQSRLPAADPAKSCSRNWLAVIRTIFPS